MSAKEPPDNPDKPKRRRISEAEHLANIRAAYLAKIRNPQRRTHPNCLAQLRRHPRYDLPQIRRQCSARRTDGGECRAPAVRGSERCWKHGGRQEAPQARGNIMRLLDGRQERIAAYRHNKRTIEQAPPEARAAVAQHAARSDHPGAIADITHNTAQGIEAWQEAQRGAQARWIQWIEAQPGVQAALDARPPETWRTRTPQQ